MGCTIAALAICDDLAIGGHARVAVHLLEIGGRLEVALGRQIARPLDMDGARNCSAAPGAHGCSAVFAVGSRVEDDGVLARQRIPDVAPRRQRPLDALAGPIACRRRARVAGRRTVLARPRAESTVEQAYRRMSEV